MRTHDLSPDTRGALIRDAMRWSGRTAAELADQLGVSAATVRRWRQSATAEQLHRAGVCLGLSAVWVDA